MISKSSEVESYSLPQMHKQFSALSGGKFFSKLDMSLMYLQLTLEETSK